MTTPALSPKRELWLLVTLGGIQFTHVVDFMFMMPLGPQFTKLFNISDAKFGLLVGRLKLYGAQSPFPVPPAVAAKVS